MHQNKTCRNKFNKTLKISRKINCISVFLYSENNNQNEIAKIISITVASKINVTKVVKMCIVETRTHC